MLDSIHRAKTYHPVAGRRRLPKSVKEYLKQVQFRQDSDIMLRAISIIDAGVV